MSVPPKFEQRPRVLIIVEVAILTRGSLILADIVVIIATWMKVHGQVRNALHSRVRVHMSVSMVMLTDGVLIVCIETASDVLTRLLNR